MGEKKNTVSYNMIRPSDASFGKAAKRDFGEKAVALVARKVCGERSVEVEIISKREENA